MNEVDDDLPIAERPIRDLTTEELFGEVSSHLTCCSSPREPYDLDRIERIVGPEVRASNRRRKFARK